jgi:hypothetical protein
LKKKFDARINKNAIFKETVNCFLNDFGIAGKRVLWGLE